MITGIVTEDEATVRLRLHGPSGRTRQIDAIVDTGFSDFLSLPPSIISALQLVWQSYDTGVLADGSECEFDTYEAKLDWDGNSRTILVQESETIPLLGMALLRG
jgi:clan AA aspartic protease